MPPPIEISTEQIDASRTWVYDFYKAFDSFNLDYWLEKFYKPDTILNLCSNPPMIGFDQIRAHFENQQLLLTSMKHDIKYIDVLSDRIYVQNEANFIVKNDPEQKEIKIKAVCLFWKNIDGEKVSAIDVYFDPTPLTDRIKMFL
jgi:ketosteroid isomerase-like protein